MRRRSLYLSVLLVLVSGLLLVPGAGPAGSHAVAASGPQEVTFYATASDGHLTKYDYDYTTAHDAASAYYLEDTNSSIVVGQFYAYTSYFIFRSALYFDTSSLPDDATVIDATLKLYGTGNYSDRDFYILVMSGADLDDPLQLEDYGDLLYAPYGGGLLPSSQWTVGGWNSIPLSYGLGGISKTGPTKFGLKSSHDLFGLAPSQTEPEHVLFSASEGGHPAELTVTYTGAVPPTVTTNSATSVTATGATLRGYLNDDGGEACQYRFQWGLTTSYGNSTPWTGSKTSGQSFSQSISGLSRNTTYHFRAQANNSAGTSSGGDRTFTTSCVRPTVTTNSASSVCYTSATLNGYLNDDGGEACRYRFRWGLTTSYGNATPWFCCPTSGQSFSQSISGLSPDTTYHFKAQAKNSAGTSSGGDRSFTTPSYQHSPPWWTYHTFYYDWAHNTTFLNDGVDDIIWDGDYYPWVEEDECADYAKEWMPHDAVWAFCGHGNRTRVRFWDGYEKTYLEADEIADREWAPDGPFKIPDLADVRLMVFGGCNTAEDPDSPGGLLYAAVVDRGVDCAVGFEETVTIIGETWWSYYFFEELVNNQRTVDLAALVARNRVIAGHGSCGGTSSYYVKGNGSIEIIPAGYGTPG